MKAEAAPVFVAILFPDDKWLITFNTVNNRDVFDNPSDKRVANNNINIEIFIPILFQHPLGDINFVWI